MIESPSEPPDDLVASGSERSDGPRGRRWPWVLAVGCLLVGAVAVIGGVNPWAATAAVVAGLVIMRVGWFFLAHLATPPPPPPDPGTLRRVRLTYRCPSCSAEVRMTSAASEDPEPPRHCMEEMELVASED